VADPLERRRAADCRVGSLGALRECAGFHAENADSPLGCFAEGAKFEAAPALKEAEAAVELSEEDDAPRLGELVSYITVIVKAVEAGVDDRSLGQVTVDELADECDYDPRDFEGRGDSLVDYKDALESRLASMIDDVGEALSQIYQLASEVPFVIGADPRPETMLLNRMERIANIAENRRPDEDWPILRGVPDAEGERAEPPIWTVVGIYSDNLQRFAESLPGHRCRSRRT
jgi:hypothetical protein